MIYRIWKLHSRSCFNMFYGVSNYCLRPMEKTNFYILSLILLLSSLCNSQDYEYDDYNYDDYDYNNQQPEDYTDDYSQDFNDNYDPNPPPLPPISLPVPPTPMGKMTNLRI